MTHISDASTVAESERWGMRLALALAALLAWRLMTLALAQTELMFDEAQYWAWSREPALGYFSKPPLIAWAIGLTTGLCGNGEACVRLASPLFYTGTAWLLYLVAARLYDARIGFWSAVVFATAPGASLSASLISTDVPLLFFWSGALLAWVWLQETRSWGAAAALGVCLGLGLLSKYAMVYFFLCAGIWLALDRDSRWLLRDRRAFAALAIAAVLVAPNILWNIDHGLVTFAHTADNANWGGSLIHPVKALEFLAAQFGVVGPVLFGALIWIAVTAAREGLPRAERMLLAFSLPVLALIIVQAFLSRAHANWAAAAYPAAIILVTGWLLRADWRRLFAASLALHIAAQGAITFGLARAPTLALPGDIDPFSRVLGWRDTAAEVRAELARGDYAAIVTDRRPMTAALLYYLRDVEVPILAWHAGGAPRDHFALTRPYGAGSPEPTLLVTRWPEPNAITRRFTSSEPRGSVTVAAGAKASRTVHFFALTGYQARSNG